MSSQKIVSFTVTVDPAACNLDIPPEAILDDPTAGKGRETYVNAGMISLICDFQQSTAEVAVFLYDHARRSCVSSHMLWLLLRWAMEMPKPKTENLPRDIGLDAADKEDGDWESCNL